MKMSMQTLTEIGKMEHNFKDILHNVNLTEGQISVILCALETSTKYADSNGDWEYAVYRQRTRINRSQTRYDIL